MSVVGQLRRLVHASGPRASSRRAPALYRTVCTAVRAQIVPQLVVVTNASAMLTGTLIASILGFAFWWVAARGFPQEQVGLASTAVAAMNVLSFASEFGLGTFLLEQIPRHRGQAAAIVTETLLVTATSAAVIAAIFVLMASRWFPICGVLTRSAPGQVLFVLGVVVTTLASVVDQALLGLLRAQLQLKRNAFFAAAKLAFLVVCLASFSAPWGNVSMFASWTLGNVVSLCWLYCTVKPASREVDGVGQPPLGLSTRALGHHALNLATVAPNLIMPVIVSALISAKVTAGFYAAWLLVGFTFLIPSALVSVLYTVGVREPARIAERLRFSLALSFLASCGTAVFLGLAGPLVLRIFGADYADVAGTSLRVLAFSLFGFSAKAHYIGVQRLRKRTYWAAGIMGIAGCFEMLSAIIGAKLGGIVGLSCGWTIGLLIVGVSLLPTLLAAAQDGTSTHFDLFTQMKRRLGLARPAARLR